MRREVLPYIFREQLLLLEIAFRQAGGALLRVQVPQDVPPEAELFLFILGERGEELFTFGATDEAVRFGDNAYMYRMVSWRDGVQYFR